MQNVFIADNFLFYNGKRRKMEWKKWNKNNFGIREMAQQFRELAILAENHFNRFDSQDIYAGS